MLEETCLGDQHQPVIYLEVPSKDCADIGPQDHGHVCEGKKADSSNCQSIAVVVRQVHHICHFSSWEPA